MVETLQPQGSLSPRLFRCFRDIRLTAQQQTRTIWTFPRWLVTLRERGVIILDRLCHDLQSA